MKCPSCKSGNLNPGYIDDLFRSHKCDNCEGDWVLIEDFVSWKERHPEVELQSELQTEEAPQDSKRMLFCPISGSIMRRFKFSAESEHRIDYSAAVGGVWLDKGEWELLKNEGLAGSLNAIVTQAWQRNLSLETTAKNLASVYQSKFSPEAYAKAKEIRAWLQEQPDKADLRAYILSADPYSAIK